MRLIEAIKMHQLSLNYLKYSSGCGQIYKMPRKCS
jgi:hypothetical protein